MKVILGLIAVLGLVGCATTQDPYAANHTAPASQERMPSSTLSPAAASSLACDEVAPKCQLGDSYQDVRTPASASESCKQTVHECQKASVPCKGDGGVDSAVDTLDYASKTQDCK
jgi:hypothetical protein